MIAHQRNIMASLGIDIWIPRDAVCQPMPTSSLWRDQLEDQDLEIILPITQVVEPISEPKPAEKKVVVESPPVSAQAAEQHIEVSLKAQAITHSFQLQILNLSDYILVVDASHLTAEQRELWHNIQASLGAEYHSLDWPLPFVDFQDQSAMQIYIKGFFDYIAENKICISLGDTVRLPRPHQKLPSLADMLVNPLLKQQLWKEISRIYHEKSGGI